MDQTTTELLLIIGGIIIGSVSVIISIIAVPFPNEYVTSEQEYLEKIEKEYFLTFSLSENEIKTIKKWIQKSPFTQGNYKFSFTPSKRNLIINVTNLATGEELTFKK